MIKELLYALVILLGIPIGLFLAWVAKDELKAWRKRFYIIAVVCLIASIFFVFSNFEFRIPVVLGFIFIVVVSSVIIIRAKKR